MSRRETKLRGPWALAFALGLAAVVLGLVLLFRFGFSSPHLVGAAIPLNESELLLLTSPVNRRPAWFVYGLDGKPRRPWGSAPLPGGIVEEPNGKLRGPSAESQPLALGLSRLELGQSHVVREILTGQPVRFYEPVGTLVERLGDAKDQRRFERVGLDGSLVWSALPAELLGEVDFSPKVIEVRHAQARDDGRTLLLVMQAYASFSARPVDAAVARIVLVDAASGRVSSRRDIARPPL